MSRIFVTGGTGFLGAWVVHELVARGLSPKIFDLSPQAKNLDFVQAGLSRQVEIVSGDICDADAVDAAMQGCSAVIHLAGLMTRDCAADPRRATQVNLMGSQNIFESSAKHGTGPVVYASSGAVYGPADPINPRPMTLYGSLKLAVEGVARTALKDHGVASAGFRPYIIYGPGESSGIAAGPSIALRAAARGESADIQFSGNVGFVHVCDVARAMVAALDHVKDVAVALDMAGAYASVPQFVAQLKKQVPDAEIQISGEPLRMPEKLAGGNDLPWLSSLPVTGLDAGIEQTLCHWAAVNLSDVSGANPVNAASISQ